LNEVDAPKGYWTLSMERPRRVARLKTKKGAQERPSLPHITPARLLTGRPLLGELFFGLKILARLLIDEAHREAHLAAIVKA
jgi:hypothetical protein